MADSTLIKFPTTAGLLAETGDRKVVNRLTAFDTAAMHEYIGAWHKWYIDHRDTENFLSPELQNRTFEEYLPIAGKDMPWFPTAIQTVLHSDHEVKKPVITLYLVAKVETLASLGIFQNMFQEGRGFTPAPEVRNWLHVKMAAAATLNPPQPLFFDAVANAYEHVFCFFVRMLGEFTEKYDGMPTLRQLDQLTPQLLRKIGEETRLTRGENAILENHFSYCETFFSFSMTDGKIELGINLPTPEERARIVESEKEDATAHELRMQYYKSQSPVHYGCPAAATSHKGVSPVRFIFDQVTTAVRTAIWSTADNILAPMLPAERHYRDLMARSLALE